jgi:N-acetylneuraminic acid mutarotase
MRIAASLAAVAAVLAVALVVGAGLTTTAGDGDATPAAAESWRTLARSTVPRTEVAAARIGDGAYVVGGFAAPDGATSAIVERYDLRRNRWTRAKPIPQAVNHAAAVAYAGDLYVVGGYTAAGGLAGETNALWRYEPGADRWSRLRPAPSARGALAAGVIGDRLYVAGGALYVLAGRADGLNNFRVAERYVPARRRWERLPAMRKARGGIAAATVNGRIVVVGGEETGGTIAQVESFDPRARRWRSEPRMKTPRHGLGAVSHGGRIVTIQGGPTPGLDYSDTTEALRVGR